MKFIVTRQHESYLSRKIIRLKSMSVATVALFLGFFLLSVQSTRFDNYQVLRLSLKDNALNTTDFNKANLALKISEDFLLDVWATNAVEGWMDVMIPPSIAATKIFSNFSYSVHITDVQASIDANEMERMQARSEDEFFSDFQNYATIAAWLLEKEHSSGGKANRIVAGTTHHGQNIFALELGKDASQKPTMIIQCGIHSREWIAVSTCCWFIDKLLSDDLALLDQMQFVIIPSLNVDGYIYTHTTNRLWRKNRQPNSGTTCVGTDLNRNYAYAWSAPGGSGDPCSETYYGSAPFSGPESATSRNVVFRHIDEGSLVSFFDIHAYGALFMSPWGYTCTNRPPDYPEMDRVMASGTGAIWNVNGNTYVYGPTCNTIYQTSGGSRDFTYGDGGVVYSFGVEAYGSNFTPPPSWIPTIGSEIWAGVRQTVLEIVRNK